MQGTTPAALARRLEGDTIKGTIQGGKGAPVHFQATRSAE
jgi:hypothetical protein